MQYPQITPLDIEELIVEQHFFTSAQGTIGSGFHGVPHTSLKMTTICTLVLSNGQTVVGVSYCADPAKYNEQRGREAAQADAVRQVWPMAIYAERIALGQKAHQ